MKRILEKKTGPPRSYQTRQFGLSFGAIGLERSRGGAILVDPCGRRVFFFGGVIFFCKFWPDISGTRPWVAGLPKAALMEAMKEPQIAL